MAEPKPAPVPPVPESWYQQDTSKILLIIAAIGVVITNVVSLYTNQKVDAVREKVAVSSEKADKKLDVIHEQTNSNLEGVNNRLDAAYEKIDTLEKLLLKKVEEKSPDEENDP